MAGRQNAMLTRPIRGLQSKFCANLNQPGLRLKPLKGKRGLWSARIADNHRAIVCKIGHPDFAFVAVEARGSAYDRLEACYET